MAKTTWILKIDGATDNLGIFKTKEEGIDAAFRLISEKFSSISETIDEVLKQRHTQAGRSLIEKFKDIKSLRSTDFYEAFDNYLDGVTTIEENFFKAELSWNTIFSFSFGRTLDDFHLETNMLDEDAEDDYFLFARNKKERIRYSLYEKETLSPMANIFLVYEALTNTPQLRKEIRERIIRKRGGRDNSGYEGSGYEINITEDTISNQIHTLKKLGIPIYERKLNPEDKNNQTILMAIHGDEYKDGFYLDYDRPITPDYSNLKPGSYIMLVYLTLKEIDKAHALSTQQQIIDAVQNKFGFTLQRQKVKNYLDLLIELGSGIQHDDAAGYWMKR